MLGALSPRAALPSARLIWQAFERLRALAVEFPVAVHVARVVIFAIDLNHAKAAEAAKLHHLGFLDTHQVL